MSRAWRTARIASVGVTLMLVSAASFGADDPTPSGGDDNRGLWAQIQDLYHRAKAAGEKVPEDVIEWVKQDLDRIGTWEYEIVSLPKVGKAAQGKLDTMGLERWECFDVVHEGGRIHLFFKRPVKSYLKSVPVTDLWKLDPSDP